LSKWRSGSHRYVGLQDLTLESPRQLPHVHHGFHLRGLQAGNEGLNGQAFVAEGEKAGVHGVRHQRSEFLSASELYAKSALGLQRYVGLEDLTSARSVCCQLEYIADHWLYAPQITISSNDLNELS